MKSDGAEWVADAGGAQDDGVAGAAAVDCAEPDKTFSDPGMAAEDNTLRVAVVHEQGCMASENTQLTAESRTACDVVAGTAAEEPE